jgi:hypothetical protein
MSSRRDVLKVIGGIGISTAVGGAALGLGSTEASATAGSTISDPAPVTTDDGRIKYVNTKTTGRVNWDGFDTPAQFGRILVRVELKRDGNVFTSKRIHDTGLFDLTQSGWGGDGEETSLSGDFEAGQEGYIASDANWDIIQSPEEYNGGTSNSRGSFSNGPVSAEGLYADDSDGQTQRTRVILRSTYLLYDENQNELTGANGYPSRPKASSDFVVEVNNEEATTSFGGSDAQNDSDDSATVGT